MLYNGEYILRSLSRGGWWMADSCSVVGPYLILNYRQSVYSPYVPTRGRLLNTSRELLNLVDLPSSDTAILISVFEILIGFISTLAMMHGLHDLLN